MTPYDTGSLYDMILQCDNLRDLKSEILSLLEGQRKLWAVKIRQIIEQTGLSCREFATACQVSEPAVRKWMKGSLPQSRDMYIRIGFAAGYGLEEMNSFLQRFGKCPKLYPRSLEDSVCIFVLHAKTLPHTYRTYRELLGYVIHQISDETVTRNGSYSTGQLTDFAASVETAEEMVRFIRANLPSYREQYAKLYNFILAHLEINRMDRDGQGISSVHALQEETGWSSSLRHCISQIRNKKWFPLRHKVISLGLHLNMDVEDINTMLQLAQMEILCAKNPVEAVVIYAVEDAKLNNLIFRDGSNDLCSYVKDIICQLDLPDAEYLTEDL